MLKPPKSVNAQNFEYTHKNVLVVFIALHTGLLLVTKLHVIDVYVFSVSLR